MDDDQNGNDCHGHGTHVAGTVGGKTYGVAKKVKIHAIRVLNCIGTGTWAGVIAGVDWVAAHHVKPAVANMSLGAKDTTTTVDAAVKALINKGVVVVVAAGNDGVDAKDYSPARVAAALTVGATASNDARSIWPYGYSSNWGSCLDLFAPGTGVKSAWIGSNTNTNTIDGTSMASPHVAGVAALYLQLKPTATPAEVANGIINAATVGKVTDKGAGSPNRLLYSRRVVIARTKSPAGTITDKTPKFEWTSVFAATGYRLQVYRGTTLVYTQPVTTTACSGLTCSFTPATALQLADHRWRVAAKVDGVWRDYSDFKPFKVTS